MLQYIDSNYDLPNKAEVHLWTHGDDKEETVRAMLDTLKDAKEDPEDAKEDPEDAEEDLEDLEDARHLYSMVMSGPYD